MKIAIVGAGFTGLTAAYRLSQVKHKVTLFEKEKTLGGLAGTFRLPSWQWALEKHYHHWFANDDQAINLIKELGLGKKLIFPTSLTSIYYRGRIFPFNSPTQILSFSPLPFVDRVRTGLASLFLKILPKSLAFKLETQYAYRWITYYYGRKAFEIIWNPLLIGKFGRFAPHINMAWFWARIKKRTLRLGYLEGGYQTLVDALVERLESYGTQIRTSTPFEPKTSTIYDKIIVTSPSVVFADLFPQLPASYKKRLLAVPHLHALNLVLITKEKFLQDTYWLNINDRNYPFIAIVQQTNLVSAKYYNNQHITYVGNYLPPGHPYLKMSKKELFKVYKPYLQKINPSFNFELARRAPTLNFELFFGPFAQPVFPLNYSKIKPDFITPIPNVYLANMDMVYPWDRGTNYAIELGEKVAKIAQSETA